jgi:hypothetical protein
MRQSDYTKHRALLRHENYVKQKAKWRDKAIEWQADMYNQNYSIEELSNWNDFFEKKGRMYGLLVEFRENGIC